MSGKKYSIALKKKVINDYKNGLGGYYYLSRKYNISSDKIVERWVKLYKKHGTDGLRKIHKKYNGYFKAYVVEYIKSTKITLLQASINFNIHSHCLIANWVKKYDTYGRESLFYEKQGRPKMKETKKIENVKAKSNKEIIKEKDERIQELLMENEFLKKLNALVQAKDELGL